MTRWIVRIFDSFEVRERDRYVVGFDHKEDALAFANSLAPRGSLVRVDPYDDEEDEE